MSWWDSNLRVLRAFIFFDDTDARITDWMSRHAVPFLRIAMGIIFVWFGALKVFGVSAATQLVEQTVYWVNPSWFVPFLGWWEIAIGVCFIIRPLTRLGILILIPQLAGTFLPLVLLPRVSFQAGNLLSPTLEGQYIIKNLLIIGAAIVIGSHVRDVKFDDASIERQNYGKPR